MIILSGKTDMLQIALGNANRPRLMIQALINTRPARHVMRNQAAQDLKSDAGELEYVVEEDQGAVAAVTDTATAVVIEKPHGSNYSFVESQLENDFTVYDRGFACNNKSAGTTTGSATVKDSF